MHFPYAIAGLLIGSLIGLTGIGSGTLLAPVLLLIGVPPSIVVGSDNSFGLLTKVVGVRTHLSRKSVLWPVVWTLLVGSAPGVVVGSVLAHSINAHSLRSWIGACLVLTAALSLLTEVIRRKTLASRSPSISGWKLSLVGAGVGLLVGATSVGSGTLVDLVLLRLTCLSGVSVVGTSTAHAVLLQGVAMAIQWKFGMVNFPLVGNLLLGSVPGVLIGSRLAYLVPNKTLKIGIFIVIMASGLVLVL